MNNILKVGRRNNIETIGRRYNLSRLISESYQTLYECELDSKLYKLTEGHINSIKNDPENISLHSKNLEILKGLIKLGESAKIKESDLPVVEEIEDEDVIKEDADLEVEDDADVLDEDADLEELEDEDVINEDDNMEELEDRDVINEDSDLEELEGEDVINEEEDLDYYEDPEDSEEITPDELVELKRHLKEIRKARRARESAEPDMHDTDLDECPDRMKKTGRFPESRTWESEKSSMVKALKNFRESSNKKAFYKSFKKLYESINSGKKLTLEESILLYKASNSAMTHLTVELEHNPEFIYTFRECTSMLARDNAELLECIRSQVSPKRSLVESYRTFSRILLESEDLEDEIVEEDENIILPDEELEKEDVDEVAPALAAGAGALAATAVDRVKSLDVGKKGVSATFKDSEEIPEEEEDLDEEEDFEEEIPAPEEYEEEDIDEIAPLAAAALGAGVGIAGSKLLSKDESEEIPEEEEDLDEEEEEEIIVGEEDLDEEDEELIDDEITDEEAEELRNKLMELRKSRRK